VIEDTLRGLGARGGTLAGVIHDAALRHRMPAHVRDEALAAVRIRDRLKTGTVPVLLERELWLTGIVGLSEWIETQLSPDDRLPQHPQTSGSDGRRRGRRPQPWMVLAVLVPIVALAAEIFHDAQLRTIQHATVSPSIGHAAVRAMEAVRLSHRRERWDRDSPADEFELQAGGRP
jgi:hypothetical protein